MHMATVELCLTHSSTVGDRLPMNNRFGSRGPVLGAVDVLAVDAELVARGDTVVK